MYLDVTLEINLSACVCVEGILITIEPAGVQPNLAPVLAERNCLGSSTICVLYIDVIHLEVICVYANRAAGIIRSRNGRSNTSLDRYYV